MGNLEREGDKLRGAIVATSGQLKEDMVSIGRQTKDRGREWQEREAQAMADVPSAVGRLAAQLEDVIHENGRHVLAAVDMRQTSEQLGAEVGGLKLRVEVLEQDNPRLGKRAKQ